MINIPVKSPMFIENMKPSCCAEIVLTQKLYVVRHNMKACKNSGFEDIYYFYKIISIISLQIALHFY
jgi:hypothetical protein